MFSAERSGLKAWARATASSNEAKSRTWSCAAIALLPVCEVVGVTSTTTRPAIRSGCVASRAPVEEVEAETVEGRGAVGGGGGHGSRLARRGALCPGSPAALTPARAAAIARRVIAVGEALATVCAAAPVLGDERVPLAE